LKTFFENVLKRKILNKLLSKWFIIVIKWNLQ
jgi:hypothetical protein